MIATIQNLPSNMVGFRASGEVTKDDFEPVMAAVENLVQRTDKLNYLLVLDNAPQDFTAGAWLQDGLLGIKNITKWNRAAIVTDSEEVIQFTDVFSKLMPGEFRGFHKDELQHAIDWTSEKTI
ncbi:STAS/SEC14 domain-containing protein [Flavobacterium sp.]|uniref:STAS/SEC14 domain-containing protein n=1 Tax=Flavobacterium sp. TaxID=239 RepID=UPI0039E57477